MNPSNRDFAYFLLSPDYDAQLRAIHSLLRQNRQADAQLGNEIKEIKAFLETSTGLKNERAGEELIDNYHHSVYQDAAHSMAAIGMLAPFLESLFTQAFYGIKKLSEDRKDLCFIDKGHKRWKRWKKNSDRRWDCHYVTGNRGKPDVLRGIMELSKATKLSDYLPTDLSKTLYALIGYRNKMMHLGFEWPIEDRLSFERRIISDQWPNEWFTKSTSDGKPWLFYMSSAFIEHCLAIIESIIDGLGHYVSAHVK